MDEVINKINNILEALKVQKANGSVTIHINNGEPTRKEIKIVEKL